MLPVVRCRPKVAVFFHVPKKTIILATDWQPADVIMSFLECFSAGSRGVLVDSLSYHSTHFFDDERGIDALPLFDIGWVLRILGNICMMYVSPRVPIVVCETLGPVGVLLCVS